MVGIENALEFDVEEGFFFKTKKCLIYSSVDFEFYVLSMFLPLGF
jgi:hypothetical protein